MFFYLLFDGSNCKSEWSLSTCQIIKNPKHIGFERLSSRVFLKNYLGAFKSFSRFMDWIFVERMKVQPRLRFFHLFSTIIYYTFHLISDCEGLHKRPLKFKKMGCFSKSHFVYLMNPKGAHYHYCQLGCKKQKKKTQPKNSLGIERMAPYVAQFHINPKPNP